MEDSIDGEVSSEDMEEIEEGAEEVEEDDGEER